MARVRNSLVDLCLSVKFLSFCRDITVIKCLKGLKSQKSLFVTKFYAVREGIYLLGKNITQDINERKWVITYIVNSLQVS